MLKQKTVEEMQILTRPTIFSSSQWLPFTVYEWLPKFPRFAPNSFMFMPTTYFQVFICWHNHYATVHPHTQRYRMLRAISTNDLTQVVDLLQSNFPINDPVDTKYGYNSLQLAAINNHHPLIQILLLRGADIHQQDRWGNTPLHLAVVNQNHEAINSLMKNGSDPTLQNKYGLSPIDKAQNSPSIKDFLSNHNEPKRNFPRFRIKLQFQQKLKSSFWQQISKMKVYSNKVHPHLTSKWQFDFTNFTTISSLLQNKAFLLKNDLQYSE